MSANIPKKRESISMFGVVIHDVQRFATIANILRKFGFGNLVKAVSGGAGIQQVSSEALLEEMRRDTPDTLAVKIRGAIEALGTTYIKFGQMLSTRYDLLPKDIIAELEKLQDASPQMDFETVEAILNETYGDYHAYFSEVDPKPLGSASIAQAHAAKLTDGTEVVLKIQRPGLLPLIRSDIDILNLIARTLDKHIEEIAYFDLPGLIREFERSIISELDFCHERANIEYFAERYADKEMLVFPKTYPELSHSNILVMRKIAGTKITSETPGTPQAVKMAQAILDIAFQMVFQDGVFHGDPHPGNVFATPDHRIGLLDFGLIGTFTPRQRDEFTHLILAVDMGDCAAIARILLSLGRPTKRVVLADLEAEIAAILQKYYLSSLQKIDVAAFANDFIAAGQKFAIRIPSEFTCAVRAVINLEGIIQYLDPQLDVTRTVAQFSKRLFADKFGQENLVKLACQAGVGLAELGRGVPSHFAQFMQDIEHDGMAVRLPERTTAPLVDAIGTASLCLSVSVMLAALTLAVIICAPTHRVLIWCMLIACLLWIACLFVIHARTRATRSKIRIDPILSGFKRRKNWF
ncbi:MAG: AarF/ABC1/UbiB kinase family protein [Proteobacteria bacterium]|nr:AarF/ABC1/UbiB kinase family protein [Pseudomonadota bacterium]